MFGVIPDHQIGPEVGGAEMMRYIYILYAFIHIIIILLLLHKNSAYIHTHNQMYVL